jgi:preprotein translocase subunit SecB
MVDEAQAASGDENKATLRPEKIYLKDVSFETPNSPTIFTLEWQPQLNFDIGQKVAKVSDEGLYEVVLVLTATTTVNDKTAYLAEIQQAGIFTLHAADQAQLDRMLAVVCPRMLYPYACAAMSDLVSRGGFPQLLLAPLNFDALYQQRLVEAQEKSAAEPAEST